jgi:hypothetical protein
MIENIRRKVAATILRRVFTEKSLVTSLGGGEQTPGLQEPLAMAVGCLG